MLFIDASRYSNIPQRTGVENYSYFLINELVKLTPDKITLISPRKINLDVPQITIPFYRLWTQIRLSWEVIRNKKITNLFIPSHIMPIIHPKNTVITIHDVAFKRFPKSYRRMSRWYLNWGTKFAVKHAKHIIVPSITTKKDLIKFYKANPEKISVISLGFEPNKINPSEDETKKTLKTYNLKPTNYFLFIGRIETKKNVQTLIKAFEDFCKNHPDVKLVLAGKPGVGYPLIGKEGHLAQSARGVVLTGYISDAEKQILLQKCLCFIFPSLFEGFGLPLLEAMEAKVPIIASKIPTSYEIAKHNALFFDPKDTKALVKLMETVARQKDLRQKLVKHHPETLKQYSWKRCAEETLKVLSAQK